MPMTLPRRTVFAALAGLGLLLGLMSLRDRPAPGDRSFLAANASTILNGQEARQGSHRRLNSRLAEASSPYLQGAARQPVDWYPWSEEAFAVARQEDKPILLDIGAIWCHWCHVMDRESYENPEIASLINQFFVPIKVDRDERPDIDRRYQEGVMALTGQGGWPLTVFLTPNGEIFFGGTYFPAEDRGGRPGLKTLLPRVAQVYHDQRTEVERQASLVTEALTRAWSAPKRSGSLDSTIIDSTLADIAAQFDEEFGGFGDQPKFPQVPALLLALTRAFETGDSLALKMAAHSLKGMALGGVRDQLGGLFHRYSVDRAWRVPHFEIMLDENASLLEAYLQAYLATEDAFFRHTAEALLDGALRTLADPEGGFYASRDADVGPEDDGQYYTWSLEEAKAALTSDEWPALQRLYDITAQGEGPGGTNVLHLAAPPDRIAEEFHLPLSEVEARLQRGRAHLLAARSQRPSPQLDRTLRTDWNGLMAAALLEAVAVLGRDDARTAALKTLDRLWELAYRRDRGMAHVTRDGHSEIWGLLDDQVHMARALLKAFEVTGEARYLARAETLMTLTEDRLWDPNRGGFFDKPAVSDSLGILAHRQKPFLDGSAPAGNSMAAMVLDRLYYLTSQGAYYNLAEATLRPFAGSAPGAGMFASTYALALHYHLTYPAQAVIVGPRDDPRTRALWEAALATYRPGKVVAAYDPGQVDRNRLPPAVAAMMGPSASRIPKAYVCAGAVCAPPTSDPDRVRKLVSSFGRKPLAN